MRNDRERLLDILEAIERIERYVPDGQPLPFGCHPRSAGRGSRDRCRLRQAGCTQQGVFPPPRGMASAVELDAAEAFDAGATAAGDLSFSGTAAGCPQCAHATCFPL